MWLLFRHRAFPVYYNGLTLIYVKNFLDISNAYIYVNNDSFSKKCHWKKSNDVILFEMILIVRFECLYIYINNDSFYKKCHWKNQMM